MAVSFPGAWGSGKNPQHPLENTAFQVKTSLAVSELRGGKKQNCCFSPGNRWNTATPPVAMQLFQHLQVEIVRCVDTLAQQLLESIRLRKECSPGHRCTD